MKTENAIQYACAVTLIVSSIAMAAWQVFDLQDVANGVLMYIAQAFLLAGSIFGLDYYVHRISRIVHEKDKNNTTGAECAGSAAGTTNCC